ncbi:hypothetical protein [Streptomyces sp. NPDC007369]|uniref:hypothetical protein n=1 Tax=Streptomyces sp. NPDC007369 TaxID=3154589 RepID=UPI0033C0102F
MPLVRGALDEAGAGDAQAVGRAAAVGSGVVNGLAVTPDGTAYLTDSVRAVVHRVTPQDLAAGSGSLTPVYDLTDRLTPVPGRVFSLNGITSDPAGRYLLTVDMAAGDLHRIDLGTGGLSRVTLQGGDLTHADDLDLTADGSLRAARPAPGGVDSF